MSDWAELQLSDICNLISSKTSMTNASLGNYVSTENMMPNFGGLVKAEKLPSGTMVNAFLTEDVLFSNIRTYFKKVWSAQFEGTVSADVLVFRAKQICDPKFLYYTLCEPDFTEYTVLTSRGAKMPRGDKEAILSYKLGLPPLPEQKAIASVLSSLDDKIDLLHRQNKTLEAMAETLFRQWFIEEAKEDWEEIIISNLFEVRDGTHDSPKQSSIGYPLVTSKHIGNGILDISSCYLISQSDYDKVNSRSKVDKHDILLSMIGTLGRTYLEFEDQISYAIKNIGLFKTSQSPIWRYYIYLWLISPLGKQFVDEHKSGSTQEYLSLGSLRGIRLSRPPNELLQEFNSCVDSLFMKAHQNRKQIQTLEKLRDTLLPKLMSGEVRVQFKQESAA
ncbi:TPA: restriction endonuclease subunit S [Acinetobacter baumannii]|uniref:restriction endonuclease subunit S n=1 Tax=Acinetobacter baumannii TaxID=470 RepID=UPI002959744E|nr:restriction endonuclease subunit S [Acinetobacter baumannii]HEE6555017.1 restriction endonuclease subunit S [Acinetobacter baumannii]